MAVWGRDHGVVVVHFSEFFRNDAKSLLRDYLNSTGVHSDSCFELRPLRKVAYLVRWIEEN